MACALNSRRALRSPRVADALFVAVALRCSGWFRKTAIFRTAPIIQMCDALSRNVPGIRPGSQGGAAANDGHCQHESAHSSDNNRQKSQQTAIVAPFIAAFRYRTVGSFRSVSRERTNFMQIHKAILIGVLAIGLASAAGRPRVMSDCSTSYITFPGLGAIRQ